MNDREAFLRAIEENPDDTFFRLVFADWLDDHGEHEEAERQRKWPGALEWLHNICNEYNAGHPAGEKLTRDQLLGFGRNVSATTSAHIEVSTDIPDGHIAATIRDRIPEFWKAWSIVTGLPSNPDVEQKCYYSSGYCCATEIYPDTHVAGPKSAEFIRAEERARELELEAEEFQRRSDEEFQRRSDEEVAERRQREFDAIQDEMERGGS